MCYFWGVCFFGFVLGLDCVFSFVRLLLWLWRDIFYVACSRLFCVVANLVMMGAGLGCVGEGGLCFGGRLKEKETWHG